MRKQGTYVYELRGGCIHYGHMSSGHYVSIVSHTHNGKKYWFMCNDSSIIPVKDTELQQRSKDVCALSYSLVQFIPK